MICVTVGAASFGPSKTRNLLSFALPHMMLLRAHRIFFGGYGCKWPTLFRSPLQKFKPRGTAAKPPEATWNPLYTAWKSERNRLETHPLQTASGARVHLPPTGSEKKECGRKHQNALSTERTTRGRHFRAKYKLKIEPGHLLTC